MQKKPILQVALDFVDMHRALLAAKEAVAGGADWLEAGTPLIKAEGLNAIRELKAKFPNKVIVADMKTMDAGRAEVEIAAKAGAKVVDVLGAAADSTISECVEAAKNYGCEVVVDMIAVKDVVKRAIEVEKLGANYIAIHTSIDDQMRGKSPFEILKQVTAAVKIPVAVAGGINSENVVDAVKAGASIVIVGGSITKAKDAKKAAADIKKAMSSLKKIETTLFKRGGEADILKILKQVSTANISDALHRTPSLPDIKPVLNGLKMVGQAVTVKTYPGDWAKPVEAIDIAKPGEVIVVDVAGVGPAVWGGLATTSCVRKKIGGVVINGAIRDTEEIKNFKFPAFSKLIMSNAGEPKGFGEINIPITISGVKIFPGDWIVGDDDGVIVIPKEKAVEYANRAMDVLEKENRLTKEILEGSTLSSVMDLLKWEKK
ncbi:MAG: bifunctional hexulose-6-phosphate synthase/ribonuclease regulator [Candidatus Firestonebacteria bacterium RIFOXYC2_FULL_39_67]|nr:MAG: bifunctional hexulose-6-phosphate synthase/ribonuclease regulator [Candidatus Firestonebacteria bacterium RIFOXYD2_FULL_39_29]OGF56973.1 MAG: bifunctional hexulose-6-phosphate synthase/ribonuclease regulator [Candidatus Firestonebacteria bacterium RIFOXYC2_FULL_39_67]